MENEAKQYELICILEPRLEEADLNNFKKELEKLLIDNNGQLIHFMEPQKRNLAYPINKQNQGIYIISHIGLNPENVTKFLQELKSNKQILRHLISVLETTEPEKPRMLKKIKTRKEIKQETTKPASAKASADRDDKTKLEEIDKKLDELVGF